MGRARDEAGNIWETDAQGNPVRLLQQAQPQMPADPTFPYQGQQAQAQAANTGAEAQVNQATIPAQITAANADATAKTRTAQTAGLPEGLMWNDDGVTARPIPGYTRQGLSPEVRQNAIQAYTDADALDRAADEIERLYRAGPGTTSGAAGLWDYLPTDSNKVFNDAGQQARGYVKRALGFTGGEGNTVAESSALYDPYLPTASDRDAQIEAKIRKLRELANDSRTKSSTILGGTPDGNGNVVPLSQGGEAPNAMTRLRMGNPTGPQAAAFGATEGTTPVPPELSAEQDALVARLMQEGGGRIDPAKYASEFGKIITKYPGFGELAGGSEQWARDMNAYLDKGGKTIPSGVQLPNRELSNTEWLRNSAVNNPFGAAAAGFLDAGGFGGVSALAGDQMAALSDEHPVGLTLGQIGGSILGTNALGRVGTGIVKTALPASRANAILNGGGKIGLFGRNLAGDMTYGGVYGGITEGDPLSGAGGAGVGSTAGQLGGKVLGKTIGGLAQSPAVRAMVDSGIPLTVGQRFGGFVKGVEDKAMSMPLVGDMIRNRRIEGLDAFNRRAFDEAGSPIGARVQDIGELGVEQLTDQIGDAYTGATQGMTPVPLDAQFIDDIKGVIARGEALPSDYRRTLGGILESRLAPATDAGELTGEGYQQATRGLKASRAAADKLTPGFENDYRDAVSAAMKAIDDQVLRGGQEEVITRLQAANAANRNMRTIEDATRRAAGGSETGTPFMFTPSQLQRAGLKTQQRFPGERPFADLADAGQEVLPSRVPNSGTADRLMQAALPAGLLGGGAGLGFAASGDAQGAQQGAMTTAALTAALLAGGTKTGQKALGKALFERNAKAEMLGRAIRDRAGIFGSATLPFVLSDY